MISNTSMVFHDEPKPKNRISLKRGRKFRWVYDHTSNTWSTLKAPGVKHADPFGKRKLSSVFSNG